MGKNKTHGIVKKGKHTSGGSGNRAVVYLGCAKCKHDEIKTSRDISDVEGRRRRGAQVDNNERYEISLPSIVSGPMGLFRGKPPQSGSRALPENDGKRFWKE